MINRGLIKLDWVGILSSQWQNVFFLNWSKIFDTPCNIVCLRFSVIIILLIL